jgi:hypothetical protein
MESVCCPVGMLPHLRTCRACGPRRGLDTKLPVADVREVPGKGIMGTVAGSAVAVGSALLVEEALGPGVQEGQLAAAAVRAGPCYGPCYGPAAAWHMAHGTWHTLTWHMVHMQMQM